MTMTTLTQIWRIYRKHMSSSPTKRATFEWRVSFSKTSGARSILFKNFSIRFCPAEIGELVDVTFQWPSCGVSSHLGENGRPTSLSEAPVHCLPSRWRPKRLQTLPKWESCICTEMEPVQTSRSFWKSTELTRLPQNRNTPTGWMNMSRSSSIQIPLQEY